MSAPASARASLLATASRPTAAAVAAWAIAGSAWAVGPPPIPEGTEGRAPRPRVCLALSGGGARGVAHVGVLKVLEEMRIPVDCIAGTSMGAIVGGLYASGMSPESIERAFLDADWEDLFNDRPPRRNLPFRRKQDDDLPLFQFEMGIKKRGLVLPGGLVAGQKLDFLLKRLTLPVAAVEHFDELPIPFRAVATDLDSGELVVLDRGNLADAVRASMAVPGAFTPLVLDGRTLVDGGLVRNLPVDIARGLGADRVVAVNVTAPLGGAEAAARGAGRGRTVLDVAVRTIDVLTDQNVERQRRLLNDRDLEIRPELEDVGATEFARVPELVGLGEEAARAVVSRLSVFATGEREYEAWRNATRARRGTGAAWVPVDAVHVTALDRLDPRILTRRIRTEAGSPLDVDVLRRDLERVYELGEFERVEFRLERERATDRTRLAIDAKEKSWGPYFLRVGLGLQADFEGTGEFDALADLTRTQVNSRGGEWKTRLTIGETNSIFTEFYQPLDFGGFWFAAPRVTLERRTFDFFDGGVAGAGSDLLEEVRIDRFEVGTDVGVQLRSWGEIRGGIHRGRILAKSLTSPDTFGRARIQTGEWRGSVIVDRLDNANFPRSGRLFATGLVLSREAVGADLEFDRLEATYVEAGSFRRHTLLGRLQYGSALGSTPPFFAEFRLGGFLQLSGTPPGRLSGRTLGVGQLVYYARVGRLPGAVGEGVYTGFSIEAGNVWDDRTQPDVGDLRPAGSVFAGVDTRFGPIYVGYGRTDQDEDSFYLFLGRPF